MNKNIIIGVVAFGGLILVGSLLLNKEGGPEGAESQTDTPDVAEIETSSLGAPIHPGEIVRSSQTSEDGSEWTTLVIKADASIDEINEWYRRELSSNGWSIKSDKNIGGYQVIRGESTGKYTTLQATQNEEPGFSTISQQVRIDARGTE